MIIFRQQMSGVKHTISKERCGLMKLGELVTVKTLGKDEQTEKHTSYCAEIRLFSCVQQGDAELLLKELKNIGSSIFFGRMSEDDIMQTRYMAVSTITLATRYAIQGGLNEKKAYDFSDDVINNVDKLLSSDEIFAYVAQKVFELTQLVKKSRTHPEQSPYVRKCICYINENISRKITVSDLAAFCGITPDYLSQIFKKEMGESPSEYIVHKKLNKAKGLLLQGKGNYEICKTLGFSSPSYFVTVFKKYYRMTPSEFIKVSK